MKAAVPTIQKISSLWHDKHHIQMVVMGIDPAQDEAVRDYELQAGTFFREKNDALLETGFAQGLGVKLGNELKLHTKHGIKKFSVTGLLSPRGAAHFNEGGVLFLSLRRRNPSSASREISTR